MAHIVGISGSLRDGANTLTLVKTTLEIAAGAGAKTTLLDLREHPLPLYEAHESYAGNETVERIKSLVDGCDALLLGSPEYHGCMSGALKNLLDFLYRELAGKPVGLVSATGGSQGSGCFDNMRAAVHACHGWVLPYVTAATGRDIQDGAVTNERVLDRLQRMARDLTHYGPLISGQFRADLEQPAEAAPGFAQWLG